MRWDTENYIPKKVHDFMTEPMTGTPKEIADFKDGAEAIIMAEKNLYGGKKTKGLTKIFRDREILT